MGFSADYFFSVISSIFHIQFFTLWTTSFNIDRIQLAIYMVMHLSWNRDMLNLRKIVYNYIGNIEDRLTNIIYFLLFHKLKQSCFIKRYAFLNTIIQLISKHWDMTTSPV